MAVDAIKASSRPVASRKEKAQIATISAHNDPKLGELVANAIEKVGDEGVVSVVEAQSTETALECVEGMQFDRGFLSPFFVTDTEKMQAVLDDPVDLLTVGIIDPTKVVRTALENVVSVAGVLLLTEATLTELPDTSGQCRTNTEMPEV